MHVRAWKLLLPLLALAAAAAAADDLAEAKRHSDQGLTLYKAGQYKEAIAEFKQAIALSQAKKPEAAGVVSFNLAQAYEKAGDLTAAVQAYRDYLRLVPKAADKDAVLTLVANLEQRLSNKDQELSVSTAPPGAGVTIDGSPRGQTPISLQLKHGEHELLLTLEGYQPSKRKITLTAESAVKLDIELAKKPPAPGKVWTWVALGASVAAAGAGGYFGMQSVNSANTLRLLQRTTAEQNGYYNDSVNQQIAANVFYGVAGVALIGAGALFFMEGTF